MANLDFIYQRKSVRQFKDTKIPKNDILELLKAATYAPSPKHQQNWHFVILQNKILIIKWQISSLKVMKTLGILLKMKKIIKDI